MTRLVTAVSATVLAVTAIAPWLGPAAGHPAARRHDRTTLLDAAVNRVAVIGDSYTAGSAGGGRWTERTWRALAGGGVDVSADVAAEGGAGYGVRGGRGATFGDLAARSVRSDDALVVFFGSRNDRDVDPAQLTRTVADALGLARRMAPSARLLVIGPPWPTADVPGEVLRIRDVVGGQAGAAGAEFVDPIAGAWFVGRPELIGPDGVHPTDAGQTYLAEMITPLIGARLPGTG